MPGIKMKPAVAYWFNLAIPPLPRHMEAMAEDDRGGSWCRDLPAHLPSPPLLLPLSHLLPLQMSISHAVMMQKMSCPPCFPCCVCSTQGGCLLVATASQQQPGGLQTGAWCLPLHDLSAHPCASSTACAWKQMRKTLSCQAGSHKSHLLLG